MEQALITQNPHWNDGKYHQPFVRLYDEAAIADLDYTEIQIITGIRRCGKSTLLKRLINHLCTTNEPKSILYINFDDPNYVEFYQDPRVLYDIVTTAEKLTGVTTKYLFLDEIQNVAGWEKYVKSVYDSERFSKIVITGSNADLLKSDYASLLSGRYIESRLYPFRFKELLVNHGIDNPLAIAKQKPNVLALVDEMLTFGGFPRIHCLKLKERRLKILQSYYETIILKDCVSNHQVRDIKGLTRLAHYIISNNATIYSYNSLGRAVQTNENTAQHFLQIFQDAYFISELYQFDYSLKKQARAKKKTYCMDNGLISAASFKFIDNTTVLLENLVYTELVKAGFKSIYFHNDKNECDFIVFDEQQRLAIQVCYQLTPNNRLREQQGLQDAMERFSLDKGIIITYDQAEIITDKIKIVPFWKMFGE